MKAQWATSATEGASSRTAAPSSGRRGFRLNSERSRGPSWGPVVRWNAKMLLVPYSSTAWITLRRMPVRIEETTTTTRTPVTTPNTVSPLRRRWARTLSNAMRRISTVMPERGALISCG